MARIKEENFIYDFFEAADQKNYEQVFSTMDENQAGNENMQEMWKANFSSLDQIKVISLHPEEEQKWYNHQPLYEVSIYIKSNDFPPTKLSSRSEIHPLFPRPSRSYLRRVLFFVVWNYKETPVT